MKKEVKTFGKMIVVLMILSAFLFTSCMNQNKEATLQGNSLGDQLRQFAFEQMNADLTRGENSANVQPGVYIKDGDTWKFYSYEDIYTNLSDVEFENFLTYVGNSKDYPGYIVKADGTYVDTADLKGKTVNEAFQDDAKDTSSEDFEINDNTVVEDIEGNEKKASGEPISDIDITAEIYDPTKLLVGFTPATTYEASHVVLYFAKTSDLPTVGATKLTTDQKNCSI